jgi:AAA+ ATPase superfamily predicted ATPase
MATDLGRRSSGRACELAVLEQLLASSRPEFLALYGRRRVGKTFLVRAFFGSHAGTR